MQEKQCYEAPRIEVFNLQNHSLLENFSIDDADFYGDGEDFDIEQP